MLPKLKKGIKYIPRVPTSPYTIITLHLNLIFGIFTKYLLISWKYLPIFAKYLPIFFQLFTLFSPTFTLFKIYLPFLVKVLLFSPKTFSLFVWNICPLMKNIYSFREKYLLFSKKIFAVLWKIFALFEKNICWFCEKYLLFVKNICSFRKQFRAQAHIFRLVLRHPLNAIFTLIASSFESCTATQSWVFFDMQVLKCTFDIIVQTGRYMRRPTQKWYRDYEVINHTISTSRQEAEGWNQS